MAKPLGQTTDKLILNLFVLALNLKDKYLLRLISSAALASFGSGSSQDNWFSVVTGPCSEHSEQKERILCAPHCILMNVCGGSCIEFSASKIGSSALRVQIRPPGPTPAAEEEKKTTQALQHSSAATPALPFLSLNPDSTFHPFIFHP